MQPHWACSQYIVSVLYRPVGVDHDDDDNDSDNNNYCYNNSNFVSALINDEMINYFT